MKVFISWSGIRGQHVANALRDWLPYVIHDVQPWASAHDIGVGERWSEAIARQLDQTAYGIVCVTRESARAPWIMFEAGALAKSLSEGKLCPYLVDLDPGELDGPLAQFQAVRATRESTLRLVKSIHGALSGSQLTEKRLQVTFERFWPDLEERLRALPTTELQAPLRPDRMLLEEILGHVRGLVHGHVRDFSLEESEASNGSEFKVQIDFEEFAIGPRHVELTVNSGTHFQDLLDRLFNRHMFAHVDAYKYGVEWVLVDRAGKRLEKQGKLDRRTLAEVGIVPTRNEFRAVRVKRAP